MAGKHRVPDFAAKATLYALQEYARLSLQKMLFFSLLRWEISYSTRVQTGS